jgi:nitrogen fixation protein FixH
MTDIASPRTSRFIPWVFVGGMAVVFLANAALIYFAAHSWTGLEVQHPYEDGVGYNKALAAQARQEQLGWTIDARVAAPAGAAVLTLSITGRDGQPLTDLDVRAKLERPIGSPETQQLDLRPAAGGVYSAAAPALGPGQWDAEVTAARGGDRMLVTRRVVLR